MDIDDMLRLACNLGASDLHLKAGNYPCIRMDGELQPLSSFPLLTGEDTAAMASRLMASPLQKQRLEESSELDVAYSIPGVGRFRVNIYHQRGTLGMALRVIPNSEIMSIDELHLPGVVTRIADERRGLVLVTGAAGSGKSTTLAAILDHINATRSSHIITIEDPIEFLHSDKRAFIVQREVEVDTQGFGVALRAALRQDPDVILVGEMRDLETIETAMIAAETGHMVYSTLHTLDAAETIHRITGGFPSANHEQVRMQLAATLRAIISQRLVRRADGKGRVPAVEVLIATDYIRECLRNPEKTRLISEVIAGGFSQYGMQTFDQSLYDLYKQGLITLDEALLHATRPGDLQLRAAGIRSMAESTRDEMEKVIGGRRQARR